MSNLKGKLGWLLIIGLSLSPLVSWYFALQPFRLRYINLFSLFTSFGQIAGLVGFSMYSLNLFLSIRLKVFEDFFGGMNKVYIAHHLLGGIAFILLMLHPVFLAAAHMTYSANQAALFLLPSDNWSRNLGILSLALMMSLLVLTFYRTIPYQIWRTLHKILGLVFFFGMLHSFYIPSDISREPMVRNHMLVYVVIGLTAYIYRTLLGRFFVKRSEYMLAYAKQLNKDVIEVALKPLKNPIPYKSGQFIFLSFKHGGISEEVHPFSVSSSSTEELLVVTIKESGDYTKNLVNLTQQALAIVEGAFGRFDYKNALHKDQVWIAGGIGITPFYSMSKELPSTLDYSIDLYYTVHDVDEEVYFAELQALASIDRKFRIIPYVSTVQGRLSIDVIKQTSGDLLQKDFFICGPPLMMKSLRYQLRQHGVSNSAIHSEEFQL